MVGTIKLEKLREFETLVKKCIAHKYSKYIPESKLNFLNSKSFIDENVLDPTSLDITRGNIVRTVLGAVIDVRCTKELKITENEIETVVYGNYLQNGLIEYYAHELSISYNINIDERPELKNNLDLVIELKEKLDNGLDPLVFNSNAIEILDAAEIENVIKTCDNDAIEEFVAKKESVEALAPGSAEEEKQIKRDFADEGKVQIVYLYGKQYIKYIDKFDEVHLVETHDSSIISKIYKDKFNNLKPGEKINAEEFFEELTKSIEEVPLSKEEEINKDYLTAEEVNMLDFVYSNKELKEDVSTDVVTHSEDSNIHVIESTNDIVVTEDHGDHVESVVIKDEDNGITQDGTQEQLQQDEEIDEKILTEAEYEELCMKFANNQELTLEELRALKRSTPELMQQNKQQVEEVIDEIQDEMDEKIIKEDGPKLIIGGNKYAAFTNKYLLAFIIILTVCLGVLIGALLFKLTH